MTVNLAMFVVSWGVFFSLNPHVIKFYFDLGTEVKHQSVMVHESAATTPESRDNLVS